MTVIARNFIIFGLAIIAGLWLGQTYPLNGLVLLIPILAFVVMVFMRTGFVGGQQGMTITIDGQRESQIRSK
jgi:hypothetical protein